MNHQTTQQTRPTLILIHGAGLDGGIWQPVQASLESLYSVKAINLNGRGGHPVRSGNSLDTFTQDILGILDELQSPAAIVGHSLGGAVAMNAALKQPDQLAGLGLISTGAKLSVLPTLLALMASDFDGAVDFLIGLLFHRSLPEVVQQTRSSMLDTGQTVTLRDFQACNSFDVREHLSKIKIPTWICVGEHDQMTPVKFSAYLAEHIHNSALNILPEAGHMVMLEQPEAFEQHLKHWLNTIF